MNNKFCAHKNTHSSKENSEVDYYVGYCIILILGVFNLHFKVSYKAIKKKNPVTEMSQFVKQKLK